MFVFGEHQGGESADTDCCHSDSSYIVHLVPEPFAISLFEADSPKMWKSAPFSKNKAAGGYVSPRGISS
jgi:hypothetical protein